MKSYVSIVLFRILEIISRFFFLGQCLRLFSLEDYGVISYRIALYQFIASILYSGTLQSLSKYSVSDFLKQRSIFSSLSIVALSVSALMFVIDGPASCIFLFYSLLYILNGWFGTQENQILFSSLRGFSFVAQALFFVLVKNTDLITHVYWSFGVASLVLLSCFPYRQLRLATLAIHEWQIYFKFQVHNLSFQLTKISERWVLLFLLDKKTFGLYSSIRDIINAANLTFFSPIYQTYYKKLSTGADYKPLLRKSTLLLVVGTFSGLVFINIFFEFTLGLMEKVGIAKFSKFDLMAVILLLILDFYRSLQMMIVESKHQFRVLYQSHCLDFVVLCLSTTLIFSKVSNYWQLFIVLFSRLLFVNLFFGSKAKDL